MEVCGLKNCCDSIGKPWPVPSREFIIAANPQIVFVEYASESDKLYLEAFYKSDPVWSSTDAVKNDAVCFMPRNIVNTVLSHNGNDFPNAGFLQENKINSYIAASKNRQIAI